MATMEIGSWYTKCSACGRDTDWSPTHEVLLGYGPDNGKPGCGAVFDAVSFTTIVPWWTPGYDPRQDDDRYPQWMKDLPLVGFLA